MMFAPVLSLAFALATPTIGSLARVQPPGRIHDPVTVFDSAWAIIERSYYDTTFRGLDWRGVGRTLREQARSSRTTVDLRAVLQRMLDTLGDSHARVLPASAVARTDVAQLADPGLQVRVTDAGVIVWRVDSSAAGARAGVRPGWRIESIDGKAIARGARRSDVAAALRGPAGTTVHLVASDLSGQTRALTLARAVPRGVTVRTPNMADRIVRFHRATLRPDSGLAVGTVAR